MTKHFHRELDRLKRQILEVSTAVEEGLHKAVKSVAERDAALADAVIAGDDLIDRYEIEVEEECMKILALHQPVASDLRFIVAVMKINNDLERIADLSVNIAERARSMAQLPRPSEPYEFTAMFEAVKLMLRNSLLALVHLDAELAQKVCEDDAAIDAMHREVYALAQKRMKAGPESIEATLHILSVSRNLERIGDHATNIAEDVIYFTSGAIVRHRKQAEH